MAFIQQYVSSDNALVLSGEEFVRQMTWGSNWTKIRIGIRWSFNCYGLIQAPILNIGICQGVTNTFLNSNTTDYLGLSPLSGNIAYTQGNPPIVTLGANYALIKRVGNVTTSSAVSTSAMSQAVTQSGFHSGIWITILRGSQFTPFFWNLQGTNQGTADLSQYSFWLNNENESGAFAGLSIANTATLVSGLTCANNAFDTISIYWNRLAEPLNISDLVVVRYY